MGDDNRPGCIGTGGGGGGLSDTPSQTDRGRRPSRGPCKYCIDNLSREKGDDEAPLEKREWRSEESEWRRRS